MEDSKQFEAFDGLETIEASKLGLALDLCHQMQYLLLRKTI
jgi:hypothetical protein